MTEKFRSILTPGGNEKYLHYLASKLSSDVNGLGHGKEISKIVDEFKKALEDNQVISVWFSKAHPNIKEVLSKLERHHTGERTLPTGEVGTLADKIYKKMEKLDALARELDSK